MELGESLWVTRGPMEKGEFLWVREVPMGWGGP